MLGGVEPQTKKLVFTVTAFDVDTPNGNCEVKSDKFACFVLGKDTVRTIPFKRDKPVAYISIWCYRIFFLFILLPPLYSIPKQI